MLFDDLHRHRQLLGIETRKLSHVEQDSALIEKIDIVDVLKDCDDGVDTDFFVFRLGLVLDIVEKIQDILGRIFVLDDGFLRRNSVPFFDSAQIPHG